MRVYMTKNMCKAEGFVNGMSATIEAYDEASRRLQVLTKTSKRFAVHLYTEDVEGHNRVTCFPVRLGYACTIQKVQGATQVVEQLRTWPCHACSLIATI